jgi:polyphenol oxidase
MLFLRSLLLSKFSEISFSFNTRVGPGEHPYYFNVSMSVSDDEERVKLNREALYRSIGLDSSRIATQHQVHGDEVRYVDKPGLSGKSDAMITDVPGLGLAISTADCPAIFIYDKKKRILAGIHSGWRSTEKRLTSRVLDKLIYEFKSEPKELIVYIAPSIQQKNYEVGEEVAVLFPKKYYIQRDKKFLLDVSGANFDMLREVKIPEKNIQYSRLCTFEYKNLLHSYRRDGLYSGRAMGVVSINNN